MTMKTRKFLIGSLGLGALTLFLVSCGGGGGDSTSGNTVNTASAGDMVSTTSLGQNLYQSLQGPTGSISNAPVSLPSMPGGVSSLSISKQETTTSCSGTPSGNLTDTDDDGIPVNGTYDFTCNYPNNIVLQGKISAKDDNDNDPQSGFDVCTGVLSPTCSRDPITATGSFGTFKQTMDINLSGNVAQGYTFDTFYYKWELISSSGNVSAVMNSNNLTYDPDADGNNDPWDKGIWNGTINFTASGGSSASYSITLDNLHVGACSDGSATGKITYSGTCPAVSTNPTFNLTVNITSCGQGTASWTDCNGTSGSVSWP